MNLKEFSDEFDILIKSGSEDGITLNEYEKSICLTEAQEQVVTAAYKGNLTGEAFDSIEYNKRVLDSLIETKTCYPVEGKSLSSKAVLYNIGEDVWFITLEQVHIDDSRAGCSNNTWIPVYPVEQDDYHTIIKNPFRGINKGRALRLDNNSHIVEIVSQYNTNGYTLRYIKRPEPIILINLDDGLSINNKTQQSNCKLNSVVHRTILEQAVQIALSRYTTQQS